MTAQDINPFISLKRLCWFRCANVW